MEILPALRILDANIQSINIEEDDYPQWEAGTYDLGELVMDVGPNKHNIFRSTADDNAAPLTDSTKWTLVNITNINRMFDERMSSQSERAEFIDFTITGFTRITGLYLGNLDARTVQVITRDLDGIVRYDKTFSVIKKSGRIGFYKFFFGERVRVRDLYVDDIPYYFNQTVQVIISKPGGIAKCGKCVVGKRKYIGDAELGFAMGRDSYSVKKVDPNFGLTDLVKRSSRKYNDLIIEVNNSDVDEVCEALDDVDGTWCVFVATKRFTSSYVYGFYETFKVLVDYDDTSKLQLTVKGTT